jgi:hypothetical protein
MLRKRNTPRHLWRSLALVAALHQPIAAQDHTAVEPPEVFRAVVEALEGMVEGVLLVDPRPAAANFTDIRYEDLDEPLAGRIAVLEGLGIPLTDVVHDKQCLFARGLPHPPGVFPPHPRDRVRDWCRSLPRFTSVVIGVPRPAAQDPAAELVVTTGWISTSLFAIVDFHLRRDAAGEWSVVKTEQRQMVMS